jgi:hypothetical protein
MATANFTTKPPMLLVELKSQMFNISSPNLMVKLILVSAFFASEAVS